MKTQSKYLRIRFLPPTPEATKKLEIFCSIFQDGGYFRFFVILHFIPSLYGAANVYFGMRIKGPRTHPSDFSKFPQKNPRRLSVYECCYYWIIKRKKNNLVIYLNSFRDNAFLKQMSAVPNVMRLHFSKCTRFARWANWEHCFLA